MSVAWFVDGAYINKIWQSVCKTTGVEDKLSYAKLRSWLEQKLGETIGEAYYFGADPDPPTAKQNAFHNALSYPPPYGPGLRVKLYWLQKRLLFWPPSMGGQPVTHPVSGVQFELTQQKAVDVGLAYHLIRSHANRRWEKLVLAAGDADFHEVVQDLVENRNVDLYLLGAIDSISEELRPYGREVVELLSIADVVRGHP